MEDKLRDLLPLPLHFHLPRRVLDSLTIGSDLFYINRSKVDLRLNFCLLIHVEFEGYFMDKLTADKLINTEVNM